MKVLNRYILKEFLKILTITIIFIISLYIILETVEQMGDLMKLDVPFSISLKFILYQVPSIFVQMSPIATLMSTILAIGLLSKHGEITAIKAGGISILRCVMPIIICGLLFSIFSILINETVAPIATREVENIKKTWLGKTRVQAFNEGGFWYRYPKGIYNIRYIDPNDQVIKGVSIYELNNSFTPRVKLYGDELKQSDGRWVVTSGRSWVLEEGGMATTKTLTDIPLDSIIKDLQELGTSAPRPEEMSLGELYGYIRMLKKSGLNANRYLVDLYSKLSFPMVSLIMVVIGIPFSLKGERHGGIALGVILTLFIGFSYWLVFALSVSLGHSGIIPPLVAAWFTNVLFGAIGLLMLAYIRQ